MAQGKQDVCKTFAKPEVVSVPKTTAGSITVVSDKSSTERVWVSTNPLVCVLPWLGTPVSPGGTVTLSVPPGATLFTSAPLGAVSASVTVA